MFLKRLDWEGVKAAIAAGSIKLKATSVSVSAKVLKAQNITADTIKAAGLPMTKDGDIEVPCQIPVTQDAKGMSALCNGQIAPAPDDAEKGVIGVCDLFNYAVDLDVRSEIRQGIMAKLESPDKAIGKAVDALVGIGESRVEAIKMIVARAIASGRVAADYQFRDAA